MSNPRSVDNHRRATIGRILSLSLVSGLLLAVFILTNLASEQAAAIIDPSPTPTVTNLASEPAAATIDPSPTPAAVILPSTPLPTRVTLPVIETPIIPATPVMATHTAAVPTEVAPTPTASAPIPATPTPTPVPRPAQVPSTTEPTTSASLTRLRIPSIGVDSEVEVKTLEPDGVMQAPSGPEIVTWYDFSSQPVDDGNAVFAGHLDYAGHGPAVFWKLGNLRADDLIEVVYQDGVVVQYRVTSVQPFAATDDATRIVASTGEPVITLITCNGDFDQQNRAYDERLVVTGVRVD